MHTNTPFQLFPEHIVRLIVSYVVNKRLRDDDYDNTRHEHGVLMPLLWVCHNFRAYVYPRFCRHCELDVRYGNYGAAATSNSWHGPVESWAQNLAMELTIVVDLWSVYTGEALEKLSFPPCEGWDFPLARELSLYLSVDSQDCEGYSTDIDDTSETEPRYPRKTAANIAAFVMRLKKIAPAINKLTMSYPIDIDKLLDRRDRHVLDLGQKLYNSMDVTSVIVDTCDNFACYVNLGRISNLAHIRFSADDDVTAMLSLARRNAQTLKTLYIGSDQASVIPDLIQDPDSGRYVEYSRLHKLTLNVSTEEDDSDNHVLTSAVPFPSLRRLSVDCDYPYNYDVLFRGNNATLEYLDLILYRPMLVVLRRHNVFTPTSHPKLRYVNIAASYQGLDLCFGTAAEYVPFALRIAPEASVR
ncbi:hypothetical protein GGI21_004652, partial [Coemansia aciculifera]